MKKHSLRKMFVVGASALALVASTVVLPSVADAAQKMGGSGGGSGMSKGFSGRTSGFSGRTSGNYRGSRGARGGYGRGYGGYGGYYDGYYGGYCPLPIPFALFGTCGPWGY